MSRPTSESEPNRESSENNDEAQRTAEDNSEREPEIGGPGGLEPTRYGDWERKGRCIDF